MQQFSRWNSSVLTALHSQTLLSNRLCRNVAICCGNQNWFKCNVNISQFLSSVSLTSDSRTDTHGNCTVNVSPVLSQLCATVLTVYIAQLYHTVPHVTHNTALCHRTNAVYHTAVPHSATRDTQHTAMWTPDLTTTPLCSTQQLAYSYRRHPLAA
jgi:hypothetical protein